MSRLRSTRTEGVANPNRMRGILTLAAAALLAAPAIADDHNSAPSFEPDRKGQVLNAAEAFFAALRSPDKTALADHLLDEAVIFVHDRRNPAKPNTMIVPAGAHLEGWLNSAPGVDEYMKYHSVLVDGTMAHVWGPYVFLLNGKPTHCGINSMSMVKTDDGWKVGNTSFTMTAVDECEALGAPEAPAK